MEIDPILTPPMWPLVVYAAAVVGVAVSMLVISHFLGERSQHPMKNKPYECGVAATGMAHVKVSADFYLFAMFFVIFDLETVLIILWAIAVPELGWPAYALMCLFMGSVVAALIYLWRLGALDPDNTHAMHNLLSSKHDLSGAGNHE